MDSRGRTTGEIKTGRAVSGLRKTNRRHIATHAGKEGHTRCHLSGPIIPAARSEPIERRANDRHTRAIRRLIVSIFLPLMGSAQLDPTSLVTERRSVRKLEIGHNGRRLGIAGVCWLSSSWPTNKKNSPNPESIHSLSLYRWRSCGGGGIGWSIWRCS
jgi:hypothetical protein